MMRPINQILTTCVCFLLLSSCATWEFSEPKKLYGGTDRLEEALAIVAVHGSTTQGGGAVIQGIERLESDSFWETIPPDFWQSKNVNIYPYFSLMPGKYAFNLYATWHHNANALRRMLSTQQRVEFVVEANHKYIPHAEIVGDKVLLSLVDLGTSYQPKCFPYYATILNTKISVGQGTKAEYEEHKRSYGCKW